MKNNSICYLCGNDGVYLFTVKKRELYRCYICDLVWIKNFKQPGYSQYHNDTTYQDCQSLFENIFSRILSIASQYIRKPGTVFEIGASVGELLEVFQRQGWQVSGIEPSKDAWEAAQQKKIPIKLGSFEKMLVKDRYDLVVINHTLEHVDDPKKVLDKIQKMLKPAGVVIIGVPNFASFKAKLLKSKWSHILPLEHKWQYSPQSLQKLVDSTGLFTQQVYTASGVFEHQSPLKEIWTSLKEGRKRFFTELLMLPVDAIETWSGHGEGLLLVAKKSKGLLK